MFLSGFVEPSLPCIFYDLEGDALNLISVNANIWFVSALFGYEV